ncbi:ParB/RepB/Spo0J family partition protein [Synechocystis sp. LKSZ1]|uniref:ParB/RepB/Spo0J family partition protein n=1 Tax=Synechocystis sp. LKSZ1 TaxID=3144951 RepID=UPI00336BBDCD
MNEDTLENSERENIPKLKAEITNLKSQAVTSVDIPIDCLIPLQLPGKMHQPRLYFDPQKIELLKESIRKHGILEPILVRPHQNRLYEIISGERRWRCCQALRMMFIPSIVRSMSDTMALEASIIAHLLNEEISAIEQTESILSLLSLQLNLSYDEVKALLYQIKNSRTRGTELSQIINNRQLDIIHTILAEFGMKLTSFVSNRMPLLNLEPSIITAVRDGKLSPSNAVLINRQPKEFQAALIAQAIGKSKNECIRLIKSIVISGSPSTSQSLPTQENKISEKIFNRIKLIRQRPHLLKRPDVIHRLTQIDHLLKDIELLFDRPE